MAKRGHEKTRETVPEKGDAPLHVPAKLTKGLFRTAEPEIS